MEEHFLKDYVEGDPEFKAEPWYNRYGDCVVYQLADEAIYAERIDCVLTLYRSAEDDRVIGFQIKDVAAIIRKFGLSGIAVGAEEREGELISVSMLLLAAFESALAPVTRHRLEAYSSALQEASAKQVAVGEPGRQ